MPETSPLPALLIIAGVLSCLWVEKPAIQSSGRVLGWMRRPSSAPT